MGIVAIKYSNGCRAKSFKTLYLSPQLNVSSCHNYCQIVARNLICNNDIMFRLLGGINNSQIVIK